jgi:hypothetical protein
LVSNASASPQFFSVRTMVNTTTVRNVHGPGIDHQHPRPRGPARRRLDRAFDEAGSPIACAQDNALGIGNAFTTTSPTTIRFQHVVAAAVPGQRVPLRLLGFPNGDVRSDGPRIFQLLVEEGCWTLRYGTRRRDDPFEFVTGRAVPLDKTGMTPSTSEAVYTAQPIRPEFGLVTPPDAGHYLLCIGIDVLDPDGNLFEHPCTRIEVISP